MERALQARIRERVYHFWNDWCEQGDNKHHWLKERAVGIADGSWLLALQRARGIATGRDRHSLHLAE